MSKESMERFDGKEVMTIWYGSEADQIRPGKGERFFFDFQYHGSYDDSWIAHVAADGTELGRHNISRLGGWLWK